MLLVFYRRPYICKLIMSFKLGVVTHIWTYPASFQITNLQCFWKEISDCLSFCIQSGINGSYKLNVSFLLAVVRHVRACTKCFKITNCQYISEKTWVVLIFCIQSDINKSYQLCYFHVPECDQACLDLTEFLRNNKLSISRERDG